MGGYAYIPLTTCEVSVHTEEPCVIIPGDNRSHFDSSLFIGNIDGIPKYLFHIIVVIFLECAIFSCCNANAIEMMYHRSR